MTETELERLVVRLEGKDVGYQRMITEAIQNTQKLSQSLDQLDQAQKKTSSGFGRLKQDASEYLEVLKLLNRESSAASRAFLSNPQALGTALATTGSGYTYARQQQFFTRELGYAQHWLDQPGALGNVNPDSFSRGIRAAGAGFRRNYGSVMQNESRWNFTTGQAEVDIRRQGIREAEQEMYERGRNLTSQGAQSSEFFNERESTSARNLNRIRDPAERAMARQRSIDDARRNLIRLQEEIGSTTGGGARARFERLDKDVSAKASSAFDAARTGGKDTYQEELDKAKEVLELRRQEYELAKKTMSERVKAAEDEKKAANERREDEKFAVLEELRTSGMTDREKKSDYRRRVLGLSLDERVDLAAKEDEAYSNREAGRMNKAVRLSGMSREERAKADRIERGMTSDGAEAMGAMDEQIRTNQKRVAANQSVKDMTEELEKAAKMFGKVGIEAKLAAAEIEGVKPEQLAAFATALKNQGRNRIKESIDDIRKETSRIGMSSRRKRDLDVLKDTVDAGGTPEDAESKIAALSEQDAELDREERKEKGKQLKKAFNKRAQFDDDKEELDKLMKEGHIDPETYNKVLKNLKLGLRENVGSPLGQPTSTGLIGGTEAGSAESAAELMAFRENAFGNTTTAGSPVEVADRKSRRRGGAAGGPPVPMAGTYEERLAAAQARAAKRDTDSRNNIIAAGTKAKEAQGGAEEGYQSRLGAAQARATKQDEEMKKLLERIAKAAEKDAETKVNVAGLR